MNRGRVPRNLFTLQNHELDFRGRKRDLSQIYRISFMPPRSSPSRGHKRTDFSWSETATSNLFSIPDAKSLTYGFLWKKKVFSENRFLSSVEATSCSKIFINFRVINLKFNHHRTYGAILSWINKYLEFWMRFRTGFHFRSYLFICKSEIIMKANSG